MNPEPFSHKVPVRAIPSGGKRYRIEADAEARGRLAKALDIPEVVSLSADLEVEPALGEAFAVRGGLAASVVQTDVVTLEPLAQEVREEIDIVVARAAEGPSDEASEGGAAGAVLDERDTYRNGRIDLGAIVSEHLALGLDPYPKAPGAEFSSYVEDDPGNDPSPFAALAKLKDRGGSPS